jgi:hypothetical protein
LTTLCAAAPQILSVKLVPGGAIYVQFTENTNMGAQTANVSCSAYLATATVTALGTGLFFFFVYFWSMIVLPSGIDSATQVRNAPGHQQVSS